MTRIGHDLTCACEWACACVRATRLEHDVEGGARVRGAGEAAAARLDGARQQVLGETTLQDLLEQRNRLDQSQVMYFI